MNVKNFLIGAIAAGFVFYFAGWVFYGILFPNIWPVAEGATYNMVTGIVASLFSGAALSFIFSKIGGMSLQSSAMTGGIIGLLNTVAGHLYMMASGNCNSISTMMTDAGINLVMGGLAGAAISFLVGKFGGSSE
jgi:hypothetical protein